MLDAYTAIDDYHYGDQPPYGCQHIFVGVEDENEKIIGENVENKDERKDSAQNVFDNTNNDVGEYKHKETERIQKQLAQITNGKHVKTIEVHYYFCPTIGKIEFKLKVKALD